MLRPGLSTEAQIAALDRGMEDCQREELTCREQNANEHREMRDDLNGLKLTVALQGLRQATWSGVGSVIGTSILGAILYHSGHLTLHW
jgi:hypothetical protein